MFTSQHQFHHDGAAIHGTASHPPTTRHASKSKLASLAGRRVSRPVVAALAIVAAPASAAMIIGASVSPASAAVAGGDLGSQLSAGQTMQAGQYLQSPGGQYKLIMQSDGNLVEYNAANVALWDPPPPTGLYGRAGDRAVLQQSDGNFVVYSSSNSPLWASYTQGNPGDHLNLQDDGNLVIYSATGSALWATMTGAAPPRGTTVASEPSYPAGQCTRYAEEMAHAYTGLWLPALGNAENWVNARNYHWAVGQGPQIGSIIVFAPGADGAGPYGHVAWVTNFYPSTGRVVFTEMNGTAGPGHTDTRSIADGINNPNIHYIYMNP